MTEKNGASVIDRLALNQIQMIEDSGRQGLLGRVIVLYRYDSQKLIEKILSAVESGDMESLRLAAHTLKSSSANVGATGIFEICRELEKDLSSGIKFSSDNPLFERLKSEFELVICELQRILDSKGGAT